MKIFVLVLKITVLLAFVLLATKLFIEFGVGSALKSFGISRLADILKLKVILKNHKDTAQVATILWMICWWALLRVTSGILGSSETKIEAKS